ncbi:tudor and KH domain-containing protein isoform 1-T2 [Rhinophrynus dorsalis]
MANWNSLSTPQKVAVTVGVTAGAVVLYICYNKYRHRRAPGIPDLNGKVTELRMTVPHEAVKLLTGRGGAIRKRLQKQTCAQIQIIEMSGSSGECELIIKGTPSEVSHAQEVVNKIIQESPITRVEICLPARCVPRIIGPGGERIRAICHSTGAKIQCEPNSEEVKMYQTRRVTISGIKEQVEAAKLQIQKVLEEEENLQQRAAESSAFRCHRKEIIAIKKKDGQWPAGQGTTAQSNGKQKEKSESPKPQWGQPAQDSISSKEKVTDTTYEVTKFEIPSPDFPFRAGEYFDIYVSAAENPEHFWIQILGSRSSHLDLLTTEMTEHYQKQQGVMSEIRVGDIVAAPFHTGTSWYRAEVLGFLDNGHVDLYYVDYGDNWEVPREYLYPLRSDFLSLPFQAIECSLAGISPAGGEWSVQALDTFDNLTHCAQWKRLLAKVSRFPSPENSPCFQVQLYDPSTDLSLDIGEQLVNQGFAVKHKERPPPEDDGKLVARLLEEVTSSSVGSHSFSCRQDELQQGTERSSGSDEDVILVDGNA